MARKLVQAAATLSLALSLTGQTADTPAYRNPDLALEKRAAGISLTMGGGQPTGKVPYVELNLGR
jgi:hypothetical protein